ncbi:hypothetical protein [Mycolicibacterium holsaticum]|uniref:hypothetical protein n=1 Tax=Mycolicibacterium holsaticum TaxID=152142 RepID=UPI001E29A781|nr:hypothetical protein [Mycolicibacterium holsaticum]MDA4110254.1 hypothetical protein [Mycolicibacterium holsaticum DSM 44478 = JCM 12374]
MTTDFVSDRLHVVVGSPWKDAVISLLDPRSKYRPWPAVPDARRGDGVVVTLDCEPRLVLIEVGLVDDVGGVEVAIAGLRRSMVDLSSRVGAGLDDVRGSYALFEGDAAAELLSALDDHRFGAQAMDRFGGSSMAAARVLLKSDGVCSGCGYALNLRGEDARETVSIWTVEAPKEPEREPVDWPAVLCPQCQTTMHDGGFATFLDYRFARHPACPRCVGRRTKRALFGMLSSFDDIEPWYDPRGCCVTHDIWTCTLCGHRW